MAPRNASGRGRGARGGVGAPSRGGDAGRGASIAIAAHVETVGVKRPGFGTGGRELNVVVNAFQASVTDSIMYQYDAITPDKLPARLNQQLFRQLQITTAPHIFNNGPLGFDGRKIAFSMYELPFGPSNGAQFNVTLPQDGPPTGRPPKIYLIKLTKAADINTEILHRFIAGQQSQDNTVSMALSALNVAIRNEPNLKYPFNTRSFFTPAGKKDIKGGLELWQGYFQSLRPSQNKMYINIDISTGVMYKALPLIDFSLEFFDRNLKPADLARIPDRDRMRLQKFISNVRISTDYASRKKFHAIKKISRESARNFMFNLRDGTSISVENYFKSHLNVTLRLPLLPCVEVGAGAMIPFELCRVVPGQIMRKQFPESKTNEMVEFARKRPADRLKAIKDGLQVLQYGQSEYVRRFGLQISPTPTTLKARILPPPVLRYGNRSTIRPANGQWNMRDKKLFKAETIKKWAIVIFEPQGRFNEPVVTEMIKGFIEGARSVGITVQDTNPLVKYGHGHLSIYQQLRDAGSEVFKASKIPPSLIVVVLPENGNHIYTAVKHFGDVQMGVATQCLKSKKCYRANLQYWANVMLKVNAKLGGVNAVLDSSPLSDPNNPTIVMGADVIHPPPGAEGRPSFTSLVSSVDMYTAKYIATSRVQIGRQEMIADLQEMVTNALKQYAEYRKAVEKVDKPPSRLIFYRDGVSEGQFKIVLDEELPAIKKACKDMKVNPNITLVIVGKRHHIRMFVANENDADKSGNCPAGTTIDDGLGHPTEFDYYQLTHGGLIGTSRPAHYSVIYDDNKFNADAMQALSFALTHVYARATRSVSIPAPVYYADIVCSRAKNHYAPEMDFEGTDVASESLASAAAASQLERFKSEYKPLHNGVARNMYFM